jgi:hypothetical protein
VDSTSQPVYLSSRPPPPIVIRDRTLTPAIGAFAGTLHAAPNLDWTTLAAKTAVPSFFGCRRKPRTHPPSLVLHHQLESRLAGLRRYRRHVSTVTVENAELARPCSLGNLRRLVNREPCCRRKENDLPIEKESHTQGSYHRIAHKLIPYTLTQFSQCQDGHLVFLSHHPKCFILT